MKVLKTSMLALKVGLNKFIMICRIIIINRKGMMEATLERRNMPTITEVLIMNQVQEV